MKDYRITVRLPAELRKRLKDAAKRSGARESEVIRGAIERQFAAEDEGITTYERAKNAGLVGAVRGASRYLSTDVRHFGDFGSS